MIGAAQRRGAAATAAVLLAAPVGLVATSPAHADQTYYVPVTKSWTVNGHGYGHGRGMSQYGAYGAAQRGLSYAEIVKFYYPGTSWSKAKGNVRVLISRDTSSDLVVRAQRGLTVRALSSSGGWRLPTRIRANLWRMTPAPDGSTAVQFHNSRGWHRWDIPGPRTTFRGDGEFTARRPLTLMVPSGSGLAPKRYRDTLRLVRPYPGASGRDTVNVLSMDAYVQGVVPYEMPTSWHPQALRAQAVAARTYAAWQRAQHRSRYYQLCDTISCQVYGGVGAEQTSSNRAVQGTAGRILAYGGRPAFTEFSASSGGWTAAGTVPYLRAKRDPYDGFAGNYVHDWQARVSASVLERSHPRIGRLIALRVTRRDGNGQWHGRALQIALKGTRGTASMRGDDLRWAYGLRSTWFSIAPTPIIQRWRNLGGPSSRLGRPTSGEYAANSGFGSLQKFEGGRIYWTSRTGARQLHGPILTAYRTWGGVRSNLGFPVSGIRPTFDGVGRKATFRGGRIYHRPGPGTHVVRGAILRRWAQANYAEGPLGYPTSHAFAVEGGQRCRFQHGTITWRRASNTFVVRRDG